MSSLPRKIDSAQRRGITLIFVVTMIVLFLLMGTAFVVVSNDYFKSARKRSAKHIYDSDGQAILERAFYDLARGPSLSDVNSPLRGHSLLADIYGYGVAATVDDARFEKSGHFLVLDVNQSDLKNLIDDSPITAEPIPGEMSGLLLSVVSGPARGLTMRIVDHQVSSSSNGFFVLPSRRDVGFNVSDLFKQRIVINGRPFSGTGAGEYNPNTRQDQAALSEMALKPNQVGRTLDEMLGINGEGYFSVVRNSATVPNSMGPNESYDTFDFQNMFLAGVSPDGMAIRPSFHRSELVKRSGRKGDFRAFDLDEPDDGVDVDNNNDGQPDGIWMDIGLPIENRPDGTCVKPLVSYLVVDLDGRINLNAHGNLSQIPGNLRMSEIGMLGGAISDKRGQGYGPPEISMHRLLPTYGSIIQERYGTDGLPGEAGVRDTWSSYKLFGYPDAEFGDPIPGTVDGHFGSAMDIHGRFSVGYPNIFDLADDMFPIGMPVASVG